MTAALEVPEKRNKHIQGIRVTRIRETETTGLGTRTKDALETCIRISRHVTRSHRGLARRRLRLGTKNP